MRIDEDYLSLQIDEDDVYDPTNALVEEFEDLPEEPEVELADTKTVWEELEEAYESQANTAWSQRQLAANFWTFAKVRGLIHLESFHQAYDADFEKQGLLNLFADDGKLLNKGTYGTIKNLDQNEWYAKALMKLWVLQFKDNARTTEEQKDIERADRERREAERQEAAEKEFAEKYEQEVKQYIDNFADRTGIVKEWSILEHQEYIYRQTIARYRSKGIPYNINLLDITADMLRWSVDKSGYEFYWDSGRIEITFVFSTDIVFNSAAPVHKTIEVSFREFMYKLEDADIEKVFDAKLKEAMLTKGEVARNKQHMDRTIADAKKQQDREEELLKIGQDIQDAVERGRNSRTLQNPIDHLVTEIKVRASKASSEYADTTDGSAGAAYAGEIAGGVEELMTVLGNCNWRLYVDNKQVGEYVSGQPETKLRMLVEKLFSERPYTFEFFSE